MGSEIDQDVPCRLYAGTSGYSFPEWVEAGFYPPGLSGKDMLGFYARHFNAIELNFTWYQIPKAEALERMLAQVPERFVFTAKLTRTMTHEVEATQWKKQVEKYREGITPLMQAGRFRAVLIQLAPSFERTRENRLYLAQLLDALSRLPIAVEFRHVSWDDDKVYKELEKRRVTLVTVDTPALPHLFPSRAIVTNPEQFYVRFHGRNLAGWRSGNMQKQFDYDYTFEELQPWAERHIPRMAGRARTGMIFFNNHVRGQAPHNAQALIEQLASQGYTLGG